MKQFCLHPGQENLRDRIESKFWARTLHPAAPAFRLLPATWTACAAQVEVNPASGEFKVAIYNAVGARVRSLPITAEAVKAAMKA